MSSRVFSNESFAYEDVPVLFLIELSDDALLHFEMARLSFASKIEDEIKAMERQAKAARDAWAVARWLRANRAELLSNIGLHLQQVTGSRLDQRSPDDSRLPVADRSSPCGLQECRPTDSA